MNPPLTPWQRLAAAARRAPAADRDEAAPHGFAARVAAVALSAERTGASIFEHFSLRISLRVLSASALVAVVAAGAGYTELAKVFSETPPPAAALYSEAAASPASIETPAANPAASVEVPAAGPASSDDPVAELVGIVS
jgi:hypothetical protein